jgi:acyl carrier protein
MEEILAALWADVLGVERIGIHDNFFELGGHSLLLVQVHRRLEETLQREIPIVDLLRYPTVSSLASYLAVGETGPSPRDLALDRAAKRQEAMRRRTQRGRPSGS